MKRAPQNGTADADENTGGDAVLSQFGRDLTKLARDGKIDPVIGRQNEIERVIQILSLNRRARRGQNRHCRGIGVENRFG